MPAGTFSTIGTPASKTNYEISSVTPSCVHGSETSLATLSKVVILDIETTSKAYTTAELQQSIAKLGIDGLTIKLTPFPGRGGTAFFFTEKSSMISAEGITVSSATHGYGASVETT